MPNAPTPSPPIADGPPSTPSLRTLGSGPNQAAPGNISFSSGSTGVTNYAALRNAIGDITGLSAPISLTVAGRSTPLDGGEGSFVWTTDTTSTDDDGVVIVPTLAPRTGCWKRIVPNHYFDIRFFGGVGDAATDNSVALRKCIDAANRDRAMVYLPAGTYQFAGGAYIPSINRALGVEGDAGAVPVLNFDRDGDCIRIRGGRSAKNLQINNNRTAGHSNKSAVLRLTNSAYGTYSKIGINAGADNGSALMLEADYRTGSIAGATNASPIVITSASHGLDTWDMVTIAGVGGNTAANGTWIVTRVDANTFSLNSSTGNAAYTSGGTWTDKDAATLITRTGTAYNSLCDVRLTSLSVNGNDGYGLDLYVNPNSIGVTNPPGEVAGTYNGSVGHNNVTNISIDGMERGINLLSASNNTFDGGQLVGNVHQVYGRGSSVGNRFYGIKHSQWGVALSVSSANNTNPLSISTSVPHKLRTGARVSISGVGGNTAANGFRTITVTGPSSFTLDGVSGNASYTTGGQVRGGSALNMYDGSGLCKDNIYIGPNFAHTDATPWHIGEPVSSSFSSIASTLGATATWISGAEGMPATYTGTIIKGKVQAAENTRSLDAQDFGVIADNSTDNTSALQSLLTSAASGGWGEVVLPTGVTVCASGISIPAGGLTLRGQGRVASKLRFTGTSGLLINTASNTTISDLMVWGAGNCPTYVVKITCNPAAFIENVTLREIEINQDATTGSPVALLFEGNTGTGGNGYVYWTTIENCNIGGSASVIPLGSSAIKVADSGNGVLFLRMIGGRTKYAERHFDLRRMSGSRFWGVECDANTTGSGTGRFVYLSPSCVSNEFISMHFESSGMDKAIEFTAGSAGNRVASATQLDFSYVVGHTNGVPLGNNQIDGFTQVTSNDSNYSPLPQTFNVLLQDTISEKTSNNGVVVDGARLYDGGLVGHIWRPDRGGVSIGPGNGFNRLFGDHELYDSVGSRFYESSGWRTVTTTEGTPADILNIPMTADKSTVVDCIITARRTGGGWPSGSVGDVTVWHYSCSATMKGAPTGAPTIWRSVITDHYGDLALTLAPPTVVSTTGVGVLVIRAVGVTDMTLVWNLTFKARGV